MGGKNSRQEDISRVPDEVSSYLLKKIKCIHMTQQEYKNRIYIPSDIFYLEKTINVITQPSLRGVRKRDKYGLLGKVFPNRDKEFKDIEIQETVTENNNNIDVNSKESIYNYGTQFIVQSMMNMGVKYLNKKQKKEIKDNLKNRFKEIKESQNVDKKHRNRKYIDKFTKKEFDKILKELDLDFLTENHKEYLNKYIENEIKILAEEHGLIPKPVYVMYSRILEIDGNFLNAHLEDKYSELKDELNNNIESLERTMFARYGWKGNVRVIIYIPNLTKSGRVPTNLCSFKNHHLWMRTLTMDDSMLYNIYTLQNYDFTFLERTLPRNIIDMLIQRLESKNNRYYFKNDMTNLCHKHGCLSEKGENINMLIPKFTDKDGDMNNNAKGKAPYLPQKCLIPYDFSVNGYNPDEDGNNYNEILDSLFEKVVEDSIEKCFKEWKKNNEKLKNGEEGDFDIDPDMISQMNNCAIEFIKDKENDKKHYSKWQPKILKELAHRSELYPGIAEVVWPMFEVKGLDDLTYSMPWGNKYIPLQYGLCEGGEQIDEIKSINLEWSLKVDRNGRFALGLFKNNRLVTILSSKRIPQNCKMQLLDGRLEVVGTVSKDEKPFVFSSIKISNDIYKYPLSFVLNDDGNINVFENGFKDVTNPKFSKYMNESISMWKTNGTVSSKDIFENSHEYSNNIDINKNQNNNKNNKDDYLYSHNEDMMRRLLLIRDQILS